VTYTQRKGRRWSTYKAFIEPILKRKKLTIHRHARAYKVRNGTNLIAHLIQVQIILVNSFIPRFFSEVQTMRPMASSTFAMGSGA